MGYALEQRRMTADEFLAWDAGQTLKREFVRGEVFLMAGGEDNNFTVAGNLYMALRRHLSGTPCRVFGSDVKLRVEAADCFFYPDLMVTCSAADHASALVKTEPKLLVEVLSPSTAAYDRGVKFAHFRRIATLQEYLLVDLDTRRTDLYRKGSDGLWVLHPFEPGQTVQLASVNLEITAEQLFAEVDPPAPV